MNPWKVLRKPTGFELGAIGTGVLIAGSGMLAAFSAPDDATLKDKAGLSAMWGMSSPVIAAGVGAVGCGAWKASGSDLSGSAARYLKTRGKSISSGFSSARAGFEADKKAAGSFTAARKYAGSALSGLDHAPLYMGLGAVAGAAIAGEDHRGMGAAAGAGAALALRAAIPAGMRISRMSKAGKLGAAGALGLAAFGAGEMMRSHGSEVAGVESEDGEVQYMDPSQVPTRSKGISRRLQSMNTGGDLTLALHGKRRS